MTRLSILAALAAFLLGIAACSAGEPTAAPNEPDDSTPEMTDSTMDMGDEDHEEAFTFGEPAESDAAARTVDVEANDDFTFTPSSIDVAAGEVVTFRITNTGAIPHDFTLGDAAAQEEHEEEMAAMDGDMSMHDEGNAVSVEPGETVEITWRFADSGTVLYGCHQPGHYNAGMKGEIIVSG